MDKYEISLWEDYPDLTSNNIPFLNERKICVIGSDTITSAARAMEPKLVSNVNGTNTFSFKIYYRYKDEVTGEENINPYLPYIINERKVKVLWKGKWYDLVIKKIEEDTQKRFVLCTCEDLFISELSKNGYELEFNSELQNNSGTAEELVDKVLKDSGWRSSENQQTILQYQEESVYDVICKNNFVASQQPSNKQRTIQAGERCLIYYSCINEDYTNVQFYYAPDSNYIKEKNSMLVTGGNCYTVALCTIEIDDDKESNNFGQVIIKQGSSSQKIIFSFNINNSTNDIEKFSNEYRAKRIVKSQLTAFDKLLGRYVDVYTDGNNNEIYGYTTTEYSDPALVVNLIVNSKDFKDTQGWIGQDLKWEVYPSFTNENNQTITNYIDKAKSYLYVDTSKIYNTALVSNRQYLVPNSTDIKNGFLGGFQKGEKYIFRYKAKSSLNASEYIKASDYNTYGINCWIQNFTINNSGQYVTNGSSYLVRSLATSITQGSDNWVEITLNCTKVCTANNLDQVGLFIQATKPCYIEDIQFFKLTQGIDPGTKEIKRIDPGEFLLPAPKTIYNYYFANHSYTDGSSQIHIAEDPKDLVLLYSGDIKQGTYTPKYNNYEKITSIEVSKSNRFNILQTIAEKFECWIRFIINHNEETGQILYDENGLPQKYVQLVEQIGNDTGISFEYGIDLKGVKRTIVSNTIATKAIIVPNENEFGKNGFCTIARSPLNYCRENFILNFDYYVQQGLLNKDLLEADLYKTNEPNLGYYFWLNKYNKEYDELVDTVNMLQIRLTKQQAEYTVQFGNLRAVTEKLEDNKSDLKILAGVDNFEDAESYALAHKDNRKVQSLIGSIAKLNNTVKTLAATKNSLESSINTLESDIQTRSDKMASLIQDITDLHRNFFKKYSRFIQEGTWQDQNYVDDDKYYLDALEVAYRSSRPQIQYDISLLRLSSLEDFSSKIFDLGDICYIQDKEFFGYEEDGVTPYKQKIIISQLTSFFDTPEKDVIKVQNYATQFDDLFQRITTAAQALQFSQGRYERAAEVVKPDGTLSFGLLQDTFDYNKDLVINSANQEVTWDNTGITVTDTVNSALKVKIMAGGIFASNDGGITWKNALRGDGISTDLLTAGRINTSEIYVYDGNSPSFRWDSQGINAYTVNSTVDPNTGLTSSEFDFSKFVRFDKFGLYGYDGVEDFEPSTEDAIWYKENLTTHVLELNSDVRFGLTWKGFFLHGASGASGLQIVSEKDINGNNQITFKLESGTQLVRNKNGQTIQVPVSLEISTDNDILLKTYNPDLGRSIDRIQIGRKYNDQHVIVDYGIWVRDAEGQNIFNVSSEGDDTIGGWNLTKDSFYHTSGNSTIGLYSSGKNATVQGNIADYYILAGNNFGVTVDGNIYASAGKIGGWTIGENSLSAVDRNNRSIVINSSGSILVANQTDNEGNVTSGWEIKSDGQATFHNITADRGTIAGWTFTPTGLFNTDSKTSISSATYDNKNNFTIDTDSLRAQGGLVGGWSLSSNGLTGGTVNLNSSGALTLGNSGSITAGNIVISKDSIQFTGKGLTIGDFFDSWESDRNKLINGAGIDLDRDSGIININTIHTEAINAQDTADDMKEYLIQHTGMTFNSTDGTINIFTTAQTASDAKGEAESATASIQLMAEVVDGHTTSIATINADIIDINGRLIADSIDSNIVAISKHLNVGNTIDATEYRIAYGENYVDIGNHTHYLVEGTGVNAGKIILQNADWSGQNHSFNIADTAYFKARVSAKEVTGITHYNDWTNNNIEEKIVYDATNKTIRAPFKLMPRHNGTNLLEDPITNQLFTIPATKAFNAGQDYGANTLTVLTGTEDLSITITDEHKTNNSNTHHWVSVDITPKAQTTKSDLTKVTKTDTINRDINADKVYTDGRDSVDTIDTKGYEVSEQGVTDYTKLWIKLENNKKIDNIDVSGAYNAGAASVPTTTVGVKTIISTSDPGLFKHDYEPFIYAQDTYYNSYYDRIYGTLKLTLTNDKSYFVYVGIDASKKQSSSGGGNYGYYVMSEAWHTSNGKPACKVTLVIYDGNNNPIDSAVKDYVRPY